MALKLDHSRSRCGASQNPSAQGFSIGAGIWLLVPGIVAALAGGFAAGRLSGKPKESTAGWHGLTTWALTTVVIFYLLTSTIGGLVAGAYRGLANATGGEASAAGGAIKTAAQTAAPSIASGADPFAAVERSMRGAAGGNDPAALRDGAVAAMKAAITGDQQQAAAARDRAAEALAKAHDIPVEQARTQIAQYEKQYREGVETAKRVATEAAAVAAKAVTRSALIAALALVLGAVAGWFGGRMGAVDPTITDTRIARLSRGFPQDLRCGASRRAAGRERRGRSPAAARASPPHRVDGHASVKDARHRRVCPTTALL